MLAAAALTVLTWGIGDIPPTVDRQRVAEAVARAWDAWCWYIPVVPQYEADIEQAQVKISFAEWDHGDGWPFDGPGGVLAHVFDLTQPAMWRGQIHMDASEDWDRLDMTSVLIHELGHVLGLSHESVEDSVMYEFYRGLEFIFSVDVLDAGEIWGEITRRRGLLPVETSH